MNYHDCVFGGRRAQAVLVGLLGVHAALAASPAYGQVARSCDSSTRFVDCYVLQDSITLFQDAATPIVRLSSTVVTPRGHIVIADASEAHIKVFGPTGALLQVVGRKGAGPGEFGEPRLLSLSHAGQLHVLDTGLLRITVFDNRYRFIKTVPLPPGVGYVTAMIVDSLGRYRLAGLSPEGISLIVMDSAGRRVEALLGGSRGTRGKDRMWRILQSATIGGTGRLIHLVSSTQDSLYTIDIVSKRVSASGIPAAELANPPKPPAVFDRQEFAAWANSFFRPAAVFGNVNDNEVIVTIVRGNSFDGAISVLAFFRNGKWQTLSGAPLVLHIGNGNLLALMTSDPDNVVLGRFRRIR